MNSKADAGNVSVSTPMLRRSGEDADRHYEERQFRHRRREALSEIGGDAITIALTPGAAGPTNGAIAVIVAPK